MLSPYATEEVVSDGCSKWEIQECLAPTVWQPGREAA